MIVKLRLWEVRGSRGANQVIRRIRAQDLADAIAIASKGKGFMLVRECVLIDEK